jgi:hypothetical protein
VQRFLTGHAALWDAGIYRPLRDSLAFSNPLIGISVLLLPLRAVGVSALAQMNGALLLGIALDAAAAYVFGRVVSSRRSIGAVCAALYAFGPFGTAMTGHLFTAWRAGIPIAATAAWLLATRPSARRPAAIALAASLAFDASNSFYLLAYTAIAALVVLAVAARDRRAWLAAATAGGAAAVVAVAVARPYLDLGRRFPTFTRPLSAFAALSADFTAADPKLALWGPALRGANRGWPLFHPATFPGVLVVVAGVAGLVWAAPRLRDPAARAAVAFVGVGTVLALGASDSGWRRFTPVRVLYEIAPPWRALRASERAFAIALLGVGVLGGAVVARLAERVRPRLRSLVVAAAVALVVAEGFASWAGLPELRPRPVDRLLAAREETGGVVYLPMGTPAGGGSLFTQPQHLLGAIEHHRPMPNGYSGFLPPTADLVASRLRPLPSPAALAELRRLDIRFVVVTPAVAGGPWDRLRDPEAASPLRLVARVGGDILYAVPGRVP